MARSPYSRNERLRQSENNASYVSAGEEANTNASLLSTTTTTTTPNGSGSSRVDNNSSATHSHISSPGGRTAANTLAPTGSNSHTVENTHNYPPSTSRGPFFAGSPTRGETSPSATGPYHSGAASPDRNVNGTTNGASSSSAHGSNGTGGPITRPIPFRPSYTGGTPSSTSVAESPPELDITRSPYGRVPLPAVSEEDLVHE